jgi:uncharacterized sporulation protein YeaH/YhbH (DUF444 family)
MLSLYLTQLKLKCALNMNSSTKMESGGTKCSSAYELAKDIIATKYDPNMYNIFAFHFSDGDTFSDEEECVESV